MTGQNAVETGTGARGASRRDGSPDGIEELGATPESGDGSRHEAGAAAAPPEERRRRRWGRWLGIAVRAALVVLVAVSVVELLGSSTYLVPGGEITLRFVPAWPGGKVVMPLGPAGRIEMATHRTPVNLEVRYELAGADTLGEISSLPSELPAARVSAEKAFTSFVLAKAPWLIALGIAGGLLVVSFGPGLRRRLLIAAGAGLLAIAVTAGTLTGVSYLTLDRTPSVAFFGLARDLPRAVSAVGSVSSALEGQKLGFGRFVGALETISRQLQTGAAAPSGTETVRLLLATDLHLNPVGARLTLKLANSTSSPVDALLLGGDMTYFGTQAEGRLFVRELGTPKVPVYAIGGNHDAAASMTVLRSRGWTILNGSVADVNGVRVMGFGDPSSATVQLLPSEQQMREAAVTTATQFTAEQPPPNVLLVHDVAQAQKVIATARASGQRLIVLHGHDHAIKVSRKGSVTIIDGGTAGASGVEKLGAAPGTPYTFQIVEFARRDGVMQPSSVTSLSYTGDGSSEADYQPLSP